jgi:hypothetical protein
MDWYQEYADVLGELTAALGAVGVLVPHAVIAAPAPRPVTATAVPIRILIRLGVIVDLLLAILTG